MFFYKFQNRQKNDFSRIELKKFTSSIEAVQEKTVSVMVCTCFCLQFDFLLAFIDLVLLITGKNR